MKRCLLAAGLLIAVHYGLAAADYVVVKIDLNQLNVSNIAPKADPTNPPPFGQGGVKPPTGGGFKKKGAKSPQGAGKVVPPALGPDGKPLPPPPAPLPPYWVHAYLEMQVDPQKGIQVWDPRQNVQVAPNPQVKAPPPPQGPLFPVYRVEYRNENQRVEVWVPGNPGPGVVEVFPLKMAASRFAEKLAADLKEPTKESKKQGLFRSAAWALQRGLQVEFKRCLDEVKKIDPKDSVFANLERIRDQLKKPPDSIDPAAQRLADDFEKQGYRSLISDQGHYTLLTNIEASGNPELRKKLAKLEEFYSTFFHWHALKGQRIEPPPYRLVAVVIDTPQNTIKDFKTKHATFNSPPLIGSGFMAQRENVMLVVSRPLSETFENLEAVNSQRFSQFNTTLEEVLAIPGQVLIANPIFAGKPGDGVLLQALALCQKSMNDENEMLTLSHQAARQLIAATGILPRNILTADWVRNGLASLFEVPPESFYASTGGPNWTHLVEFKAWKKAKKLDAKDARATLLKIIADEPFRHAQAMTALAAQHPDRDEQYILKEKADEEYVVARATAWSLMYYLIAEKDQELQRYLGEIRNLPRDLDYDAKVLRNCFYRAFGLLEKDAADPSRLAVNVGKLEALARDWFRFMDGTSLDSVRFEGAAIDWLDPASTPAPPGIVAPPGPDGKR